jgi:hypothetical protein
MKKQKTSYILMRVNRFSKKTFWAKKEISFEIKLQARLFLDEAIYKGNKMRLETLINQAIDENNRDSFDKLCKEYLQFTWE